MSKPHRTDYAYAVGRIRVLEKDLIPGPVFREAAGEKEVKEALNIIFDAGRFLDENPGMMTPESLDNFLKREEEHLINLADNLLLEGEFLRLIQEEDQPESVLSLALRKGNSFLIDYLRHKIDLLNLKAIMRGKYMELSLSQLEPWIFPGGFLNEKDILTEYDEPLTHLGESLRFSPYASIWEEGLEALSSKETFRVLERKMENLLMDYLNIARRVVFGPEPVCAYALAKKHEFKYFRLVVYGRLRAVPGEIIQERLGRTYAG
ncbi:MAG: V-type ATPase subunit [Acidobacteriota bacterium]